MALLRQDITQAAHIIPVIWRKQTLWRRVVLAMAIMLIMPSVPAKAQDTVVPQKESVVKKPPASLHSPHKATIYAMVLPGLGQAYNHKYWKIPIVYAGFGTMYYFIRFNTKYYHDFRDAYEYVTATVNKTYPPIPPNYVPPIPDPPNEYAIKYSSDQLLEARQYYRRNLELSYIATGAWYVLTVVDAVVDAHFYDYNINDDITLHVDPFVPVLPFGQQSGVAYGARITVKF